MIQSTVWYMDVLRAIFAFFDVLVYSFLSPIIHTFFDITEVTTNTELFNGIYIKIYIILGIFMAFKLTFSFFRYLVNPDLMSDKGKGVGKLFIRVFTMLFALMFLPSLLFTGIGGKGGLLPRAQKALLPLVPKLILGGTGYESLTDQDIDTKANMLITTTLNAFIYAPEELRDYCYSKKEETEPLKDITELPGRANLKCRLNSWQLTEKLRKSGQGNLEFYKYTYIPIVSTATGILLNTLFFAIALDLAKRLFKLIVLQIIAPVPIMSLIDPAVNYNDTAFAKWLKNLISTFCDIFVKTGLVYLILIFIDKIGNSLLENGLEGGFLAGKLPDDPLRKGYLIVLLILGLVFFAKQAPKFIKESLGMKADKGGLFDDVKSIAKLSTGIGAMGVGAGAALARNAIGTLGTTAAAVRNRHGFWGKLGGGAAALGSGLLFGSMRSMAMGAMEGKKGIGKGKNFLNAAIAANAGQGKRNAQRTSNVAQGSNFFGRTVERGRKAFTGFTSAERTKYNLEMDKNASESYKALDALLDSAAKDEMITDANGNDVAYSEYLAALENNDSAWAQYHGWQGIAEASSKKKDFKKQAQTSALAHLQTSRAQNVTDIKAIQAALSSGNYASVAGLGVYDQTTALDTIDKLQSDIDTVDDIKDAAEHFVRDAKAIGADVRGFKITAADAVDRAKKINSAVENITNNDKARPQPRGVANSNAVSNSGKK